MIQITAHAIARYIERIEPVSKAEARRRIVLHFPAFEVALRFGAPCVRNGNGVGFVLKGRAVTTVFSDGMNLGPRPA